MKFKANETDPALQDEADIKRLHERRKQLFLNAVKRKTQQEQEE
jgi:hypothetical protein